MRGRTLALSILLVAAGVAGCGDDGGSDADAQPFIDAFATSLQDEEGAGATDEQADCIAEQAIDTIGVDTLEEAGVTPEDVAEGDGPEEFVDLSEGDAREIAEAFVDCDFDFAAAFTGPDASDELVACVDDNLDEDAIVEALTLQFLGDEEAAGEASTEMFATFEEECASLAG
jgi:hypothetical protein